MNHNEPMAEQPIERTWQQAIDRLVDGELSNAESRELLALLDGIDGGWRRLALAYVEAQWLGSELTSLVHAGAGVPGASLGPAAVGPAPPQTSCAPITASSARHPRFALMALAIAASMLVAFGLNLWWREIDVAPHSGPTAPVTKTGQPASGRTQLASQPDDAGAGAVSQRAEVPSSNKNNIHSPSVALQKPALEPRLVVIGSGGDLREQDSATTVPPQVIEALRRMGHRVDQRSGILPVRLKDGRNVDVPYDQVDVQYRGASSFQ